MNNYPINVEDVTNEHRIFGPDLEGVRGKTVRHKPYREDTDLIPTPRDLYEIHKFVNLTADGMFINGIVFLTTLSRKTTFINFEHIPYHMAAQLIIS